MWGDNSFGQLGSGDKIDRMSGDDAVQIVLPEGPIKTMSCGWRHTLALTRSGELYVWGHTLGYGFQGKGDMVEDETQEEHTSPVRGVRVRSTRILIISLKYFEFHCITHSHLCTFDIITNVVCITP